MTHARTGLLWAVGVCSTVLATPVLAQWTYPAPVPAGPTPAQGYYYNSAPPAARPMVGAAPVTAGGAGMGVAASAQPWCRAETTGSNRVTALCGPP